MRFCHIQITSNKYCYSVKMMNSAFCRMQNVGFVDLLVASNTWQILYQILFVWAKYIIKILQELKTLGELYAELN